MTPDHDPSAPQDSAFDLRARAELALACEPGDIPPGLFRHAPPLWKRRGVLRAAAGLLVLGGGSGAVLAMRPPALVRGAIEHEFHERTLRGTFMDARPLLRQLGLDPAQSVPGYPQLMRPCDIDGRLVYHLTTFFEKGGMVTVFAFDQPASLAEGHGWWADVHWQVVRSRDGRPLVLVAQQRRALGVAAASLRAPA